MLNLQGIYYYNENEICINRLEVLRSKKPFKFYYYDNFYSNSDWSKEPEESLQELYRQRAQQIRDDYEYVVVCYSGGIDSTQVLESFYYNNIHIDEILVVGALSQDESFGVDMNHNADLYFNVFPTLNSMSLPNTKISIIDYTKYFNDPKNFTLIEKYGSDYMKHIGVRTSVHNLFWYDLDKFLDTKKRTAYVMGKDKPIVQFDNELKKHFLVFNDISYADYGNRYEYDNGKRVNFYSEPESFKLMLKQCYTIKNSYFNIKNYIEDIKPLIYDIKNPLTYRSLKSKSTYLSARDMYLIKNKNSDIYNIYAEGIKKLSNSVNVLEKVVLTSRKYYF